MKSITKTNRPAAVAVSYQEHVHAGSSLAQLLAEHRGVRNHRGLPPLCLDKILEWADAYYAQHEVWPNRESGAIGDAPSETWGSVESALHNGRRGLPGGSSLAQLLAEHRGARNAKNLPTLKIGDIFTWVMAYHERTGKWPRARTGVIEETPEGNWRKVDNALRLGLRWLPGGSSLTQLIKNLRTNSVTSHKETLPP